MTAYRIIGQDRPGRWLVTCDHASNRVPDWVAGYRGAIGLVAPDAPTDALTGVASGLSTDAS